MPVARYFLMVGGALLALLFLIDAYAPSQAVIAHAAPSIDRTVVRIRSDQKPPERVVYDTSLATIVPPKVQVAEAPQPPVTPDFTAQSRVRDTFAQFVPADVKKPEVQAPRKRKVARHVNPPIRLAQQQQHLGFFGNSTW